MIAGSSIFCVNPMLNLRWVSVVLLNIPLAIFALYLVPVHSAHLPGSPFEQRWQMTPEVFALRHGS